MRAFEIVRQLRAKQRTILDRLPDELRDQYDEIEAALRHIDSVIAERGAVTEMIVPRRVQEILDQDSANLQPSRVSLSQRRSILEQYLRDYGPAKRGQILLNTKIPPGTLSVLLQEDAFERTTDGLWRLKE
jgi:hypothetical protein